MARKGSFWAHLLAVHDRRLWMQRAGSISRDRFCLSLCRVPAVRLFLGGMGRQRDTMRYAGVDAGGGGAVSIDDDMDIR
jgi:hypothetical protein